MYTKEELAGLLDEYRLLFPGEGEDIKIFAAYLERNEGDGLYSRKNFDGHITTSAFIVDRERKEILLLLHKTLGKWFQPGGHTEGDASLLASAMREAIEETGISAGELMPILIHENSDVPFDIDSHYIPANPKKEEEGHYHHDHRYLFAYNGTRDNRYNTEESTGMQWVAFDSLVGDSAFGDVIKKIRLNLSL